MSVSPLGQQMSDFERFLVQVEAALRTKLGAATPDSPRMLCYRAIMEISQHRGCDWRQQGTDWPANLAVGMYMRQPR